MSKIRVGVMGQGRSGYNIHVNCITGVESVAGAPLRALCSVRTAALDLGAPRSAEKFEVVAVADKLQVRRDEAQAELGCEVYDDWRKMLAAGARFSAPPAHLRGISSAFRSRR